MARRHLQEALAILIITLFSLHTHLPFKEDALVTSLCALQKNRIRLRLTYPRILNKTAKYGPQSICVTLTTHFVTLDKLVQDYKMDASRIYKLYETGEAPEKDFAKTTTAQYCLRSKRSADYNLPEFLRASLVTFLVSISSDG